MQGLFKMPSWLLGIFLYLSILAGCASPTKYKVGQKVLTADGNEAIIVMCPVSNDGTYLVSYLNHNKDIIRNTYYEVELNLLVESSKE